MGLTGCGAEQVSPGDTMRTEAADRMGDGKVSGHRLDHVAATHLGRGRWDQLSMRATPLFEPIIQRSFRSFSKVAFKAALATESGKITGS